MFNFDNTHIFTGYLKQKLASVNIPACKIYTKEFADYYAKHKEEDPRIITSIDTVSYTKEDTRLAARINYLKGDELYNYFWPYSEQKPDLGRSNAYWNRVSNLFYTSEKKVNGLTRTLNSPGNRYDTITHEYLGDYLRFIRDYHNINLMPLYNCFTGSIKNNIYMPITINNKKIIFNSQDSDYKIYGIPVKLFSNYTIAIDSYQSIEMFCGFYRTGLDASDKAVDLINKTYYKTNQAFFNQPFLYDKLDIKNWLPENELTTVKINSPQTNTTKEETRLNNKIISRWDIANRESDLKLFIKVPASSKSSIVILEGDYRNYNDAKYAPESDKTIWSYKQNHNIINFEKNIDLNETTFKPITRLQLLEFNSGESHPFADRLVEYLSGSVITSLDPIPDNIKRAQRVMEQNGHYFQIEGLWENKMQKIIYDYIINSGPFESDKNGGIKDKRKGYHPQLGHNNKSLLFDSLGYIDREAEKWYSSHKNINDKATVVNSIQNIDIYNGLYDI